MFGIFAQDIEKGTEREHKALTEGKGDSDLSLFSFPLDRPGDLDDGCKTCRIVWGQERRDHAGLEAIFFLRVAVGRVD
jgi:hypothetical protein